MSEAVREWWAATAAYFQAEADVDVGLDWGFEDVDDGTMVGDVDGADVVELGCGGGQLTVGLARRGADVTGVDLSTEQLSFARERATEHGVSDRIEFVHGDVTDIPVADESFDLACDAFVFQWVDDLDASFRDTRRVLRPGGRFAFATPHPYYRLLDVETMLEPGSPNPDDYEEGPWGERRPELLAKVPAVLAFAATRPA